MKKNFVLLVIALLSLSLLFSRYEKDIDAKTFMLHEGSPIFLSFENYKMEDGWTPVVLSVGKFRFRLWMDAAGRVSEMRKIGDHAFQPVFSVDLSTQSVRMGSNRLDFNVYEQNTVRTRWKLSPRGTPVPSAKKILLRKGGADIYIGNIRLQLNGPGLVAHRGLIYEKASGTVHSAHVSARTGSISRSQSAGISSQERAALIALYNSTAGDNWHNNSGWKTPPLDADGFAMPGTENSWYGIYCDEGNTTVLRIELSYNKLNGPLPPELGNLANLYYIDLFGNQLSGSIPPGLGNLPNLFSLDISINQLSGPIPPELGNLANLYYLSLYFNQLSGSIPPELGNLTNLEVLNLCANQFDGSIPPELGNLANLFFLDLSCNEFSGIPPELGNLANLYHFFLEYNQISGNIPPELGNLTNLRDLYLHDNHLSGPIPPELGNLVNLWILYLFGNQLSGSIPPDLANLTNLRSWGLGIEYNALYTDDDTLRAFLDSNDPYWEPTQTIAPVNVTATSASASSIDISWEPILYSYDSGGYMVYYGTTPGEPYTYFGITADKYESSLTVTGLNGCTTYYFVVQTRTDSHGGNFNTIDSEYSLEVSAETLSSNCPPVAVCKNVETAADENNEAYITPADVDGGSYDPDEGDEITLSLDTTGPFGIGTHTVNLTVTDQSGESDSCAAEVKVYAIPAGIANYIRNLPDDYFSKNSGQKKKTFKNKFDAVRALIGEEKYQEAIDKLTNDIRPKVDGKEPPKDWVINADAQAALMAMIDSLIEYLQEIKRGTGT